MTKVSSARIRLLSAAIGLTAAFCPVTWAYTDIKAARLCQPVVPQIVIEFESNVSLQDGLDFLVQYDEAGSMPFSRDTFSRNVRTTSCWTNAGRCIASRKRYETRWEGPRFQSIQLRTISGDGNPILGGVRWTGPAYPHRVTISCNMSDLDTRTACNLVDVATSADPNRSVANDDDTGMRRMDRCQPSDPATSFSV